MNLDESSSNKTAADYISDCSAVTSRPSLCRLIKSINRQTCVLLNCAAHGHLYNYQIRTRRIMCAGGIPTGGAALLRKIDHIVQYRLPALSYTRFSILITLLPVLVIIIKLILCCKMIYCNRCYAREQAIYYEETKIEDKIVIKETFKKVLQV